MRAPKSETFTFFLETTDFVKVKFDGDLVVDSFGTGGGNQTFSKALTEDVFYDIEIQYKEEENEASMKLLWQSISLTKEIIPEFYLYYYENISGYPKEIEVLQGNTVASKSIAYDFPTAGEVGSPLKFKIESRNAVDSKINNTEDNYQIFLTGPGTATTGDVYGVSSYDATLADGTYNAQVTPVKPGSYKIEVKLNGEQIKDSPFTVTVEIGKPSAVTSQITGVTFPLTVEAGQTFSFSLELYDAFSNKYSADPTTYTDIDALALFQSSPYTSPIGVADIADFDSVTGKDFTGAVVANGDGTYTITFSVLRAGVFNLNVNLNENPLIGMPQTVNVQPGPVDAQNCHLKTALAASYTAGALIDLEYQCRDIYFNNATKVVADFSSTSASLAGPSALAGTLTDIAASAGCFSLKFTPTQAATYTLDSKIEGIKLPEITLIVLAENVASSANSTLEVVDLKTSYFSGEEFTVRVTSVDQFGNTNLLDTTTSFSVELKGTSPVSSAALTLVSKGNGVFEVKASPTVINTYSVEATLATVAIQNSPVSPIQFNQPASSSGKETVFTVFGSALTAGESSTDFKLETKDSNNNVKFDSNDQFLLYIKDASSESLIESTPVLGTHTFEVELNKAGVYQAELALEQENGLYAFYFKDDDFTNLLGGSSYNKFSETISYTKVEPTIDLDTGYNPLIANFPNTQYSVKWTGFLRSEITATYEISAVVSGKIKIYLDNTLKLEYDSQNPSVSKFNYSLTAYKAVKLSIEYVNITSRNQFKLYWNEPSMANKAIIPSSALLREVFSDDTPKNITVSPSKSRKATLKSGYSCILGVSSSATIEVFDIYDNKQTHTSDSLTGSLTDGTNTYGAVCAAGSAGEYNCSYTAVVLGSNYKLKIYLTAQGETVPTEIQFSELFDCQVSNIDTTKTVVTGTGLTDVIAGEIAEFRVELFNSANIKKTKAGDNVNVTVVSATETVTAITVGFENEGYKVNFKATDTQNPFTITVTVNNDSANADTFNFNLKPGFPDFQKSSYSSLTSTYSAGSAATFDLNLVDAFNNNHTEDIPVAVQFKGDSLQSFKATQSAANSNVFNVAYNFTGNCGDYNLSSFPLKTGFRMKYYDDYFLAGKVLQDSTLTNLNLVYNSSTQIFPGINKQFTSIKIFGFLAPLYNEAYTLKITTNSHVKFLLDHTVKVDSKTSGKTSVYTITETLSNSAFYEVDIELFIDGTDLNFLFEWSSSSQTSETPSGLQKIQEEPIQYAQLVKVVSKPGIVVNPKEGTSFSLTSTTLVWEAPLTDGCSPITKYEIHKDNGSGVFSLLGDTTTLTYTDVIS